VTEPDHPALHQSVFARLVAIMVAMAAGLLALVAGFYFGVVIPALHASASRYAGQYVKGIAALTPDSAAARRLADSLDIQMRWEGDGRTWTTDPELPTLAHLRLTSRHFITRHVYYVTAAPQGAAISWRSRRAGASPRPTTRSSCCCSG
jgi:hypothetical protein